jgi:hypothetical protein
MQPPIEQLSNRQKSSLRVRHKSLNPTRERESSQLGSQMKTCALVGRPYLRTLTIGQHATAPEALITRRRSLLLLRPMTATKGFAGRDKQPANFRFRLFRLRRQRRALADT